MITKKGKIKKKYFRAIRNLVIVMVIISVVLLILLYNIPEWYYKITEGSPAMDFCIEKCDGKDVSSSNNNSQYNFIRCECVGGLIPCGVYRQDVCPVTGDYYFDSQTYQELNETEVIKRIEASK